ncbi:MAG: aspartate--tRNA ligase [Spirochaetes bacterium]|nr:aspartate--tRNA ligase [Spirochaetota bacterium]
MHAYRTHTCNDLRKTALGQNVRLSGWINNKRDHGGILFIDLRDHYGITQIVIPPTCDFQNTVSHLPKETVVRFDGTVIARTDENINPKLPTGEIEVTVTSFEVLGPAEIVPFSVFPDDQTSEELRLKYRFLDLRKDRLHKNIMLRSNVVSAIRAKMTSLGFHEFQTPILTASSPEGARDYLVPSRVHPGTFYALPQAPQQFKQLLMISGFDRYFQIAPCFRDEDSRADRSPGEFYQLDVEMSFVTQDDVFATLEDVMYSIFTQFSSWKMAKPPFVRIPYREAMLKYGSDKPDLRIPIENCDVSDIFKRSEFKIFKSIVEKGGVVRAIPVKGIVDQPRSFFDKLVEYAQSLGSKGLAYLQFEKDGTIKGPLMKFLDADRLKEITDTCGIGTGDVVFFICEKQKVADKLAGDIRLKIGNDLGMVEKDVFKFCWITDFPMFEYDEIEKKIVFSHNPFSMPQGGMEALTSKDPLDILAFQYDIVCNGIELSSGAIRNHRPDIMYKAFEIAGYDKSVVDTKFPALINAFRYGAPPHGGIAPGIDRMVMLLANETNIREVITFPMNQKAQDLLMGAPAPATPRQLRELHIEVVKEKE